jgi:hypothetical protein
MNGTDAMRARQKARIQEIPDAPVSNGALRSVNLACRKFLEQRGMRQSGSRTVVRLIARFTADVASAKTIELQHWSKQHKKRA